MRCAYGKCVPKNARFQVDRATNKHGDLNNNHEPSPIILENGKWKTIPHMEVCYRVYLATTGILPVKNWEFNTEKGNVRNHPAGSNPEYGDLTRNNGHHTNKKQQSQVRKNWIVWGCLKIGYPIPSPSESPISISNWPVGIFRHTQKHNTLSNFDIRLISCFPWVLYKTRLMILG